MQDDGFNKMHNNSGTFEIKNILMQLLSYDSKACIINIMIIKYKVADAHELII